MVHKRKGEEHGPKASLYYCGGCKVRMDKEQDIDAFVKQHRACPKIRIDKCVIDQFFIDDELEKEMDMDSDAQFSEDDSSSDSEDEAVVNLAPNSPVATLDNPAPVVLAAAPNMCAETEQAVTAIENLAPLSDACTNFDEVEFARALHNSTPKSASPSAEPVAPQPPASQSVAPKPVAPESVPRPAPESVITSTPQSAPESVTPTVTQAEYNILQNELQETKLSLERYMNAHQELQTKYNRLESQVSTLKNNLAMERSAVKTQLDKRKKLKNELDTQQALCAKHREENKKYQQTYRELVDTKNAKEAADELTKGLQTRNSELKEQIEKLTNDMKENEATSHTKMLNLHKQINDFQMQRRCLESNEVLSHVCLRDNRKFGKILSYNNSLDETQECFQTTSGVENCLHIKVKVRGTDIHTTVKNADRQGKRPIGEPPAKRARVG